MQNVNMGDPNLPWPECLGTFDEDSCRYFLRELGQRIVQFYPFSVGMEEVHTQMLDRYGSDGISDALSVLQELLEDDSAAGGIGDDGDIWRSWRHAWRHRNHDVHNPYVPRVRGRILPPATSTRIRLLKATNYSLLRPARSRANSCHLSRLVTVDELEMLDSLPSRNGQGYSKNVSLVAEPRSPSMEILECTDETTAALRYLKDDANQLAQATLQVEHRSGSPRRSMPLPSRKYSFPFNLISPRRRNSAVTPEHLLDDTDVLTRIVINTSSENSPSGSPQNCFGDLSANTPPSQYAHRQDNRYSLPSDLGSLEIEATPSKNRAVNRQARMIDGALIQGEKRRGKSIKDNGKSEKFSSDQVSQPCFHSQKSSRASWLHTLLHRLQSKQRCKHTVSEVRQPPSSLGDCVYIGHSSRGPSQCLEEEVTNLPPRMNKVSKSLSMGLDGAWDEEHNNKPLPLSPCEQSARPSIQSENERYFFQPNSEVDIYDFRNAHTPPQSAHSTRRDELRSLVSATMSGPLELSKRDEDLKYRYSDNSSASPPVSPKSFTTFMSKNPFRHSGDQPSEGTTHSSAQNHGNHAVSSTVWPFRANGTHQTSPEASRALIHQDGIRASPQTNREPQPQHGLTSEDDSRGRRPVTPPTTPSRSKFGLKARSPQKISRARSRSPVKRLVGMVKSMSTNQIPTASIPPKNDTPASAKSKKWKELSNKLRNGFLTADLEQLEQEELMDQYVHNSSTDATRVVTPPSTHDRIIFPVSIRSSGQSKLWSELEYMLIETSNTFIKSEVEHGRIPRESIIRTKRQWQARNRPQVIEFYYDQATQYELIISNLRTIKLYSDYAQDAIMLNSVLHQWKILVRELSVKTLCMPDSIVRRWLHDGRRVLELLGASTITLTNMDKLTTLCMAVIGSAEKERARLSLASAQRAHRRSASDGSQTTIFKHEEALLRGSQTPPPLPTPTSLSTNTSQGSRKVTPQDIQEHLRRKAPGRTPTGTNQFVFTSGGNATHEDSRKRRSPAHGYSRSHGLTPSEERARFVFD